MKIRIEEPAVLDITAAQVNTGGIHPGHAGDIARVNGFETLKEFTEVCNNQEFELDEEGTILDKEKLLFLIYAYADKKKDDTKSAATDAQKAFDVAKARMIDYLVANDKGATARYEGIGYIGLTSPEFRAYTLKEDEDKLFDFLKEKGYGAIIKPTVHHKTLANSIQELRVAGETLPEYIKTSESPNCKFYQRP